MFRQASRRRLPTLLMMGRRCHSFRHEGIRYSFSFVRKSTGPFAKESHSSKTAIAAMICAASVMAVSTANHHQNTRTTTTTTHMQGRFSFGSRQESPQNNKKLLSHPNSTVWNKHKGVRFIYSATGDTRRNLQPLRRNLWRRFILKQSLSTLINTSLYPMVCTMHACKDALKKAGISTNDLDFDFQGDEVEGTPLPAVPKDESHDSDGTVVSFFESFFSSSSNAVETAIQEMFAK